MPEKIVSYKCCICEQNYSSYDDCVKCEYNHFDFSKLKDGVILFSIFKKDGFKKLEEGGYCVNTFKIVKQNQCNNLHEDISDKDAHLLLIGSNCG